MIQIDNLPSQEKVVIQASSKTYIRLHSKSQKIQISCSKLFTDKEGEINVFVNNLKAFESSCVSYLFKNESYCLTKFFEFDLTNLSTSDDFFTVDCFIAENPKVTTSTKIYKLCKLFVG